MWRGHMRLTFERRDGYTVGDRPPIGIETGRSPRTIKKGQKTRHRGWASNGAETELTTLRSMKESAVSVPAVRDELLVASEIGASIVNDLELRSGSFGTKDSFRNEG